MSRRVLHNVKVAAAAAVDTDLDTVLDWIDLLALRNFTIVIKNLGAQALNACVVAASPMATGVPPITVDNTTFATLAGGASLELKVTDNARAFYRIQASVAASTTTLDIWIVGGD